MLRRHRYPTSADESLTTNRRMKKRDPNMSSLSVPLGKGSWTRPRKPKDRRIELEDEIMGARGMVVIGPDLDEGGKSIERV